MRARAGRGTNQYRARGSSTSDAVTAQQRRAIEDQINSEVTAGAFGADPVNVKNARSVADQIRAAALGTNDDRARLASRPSCPPALLDWLADNGDAAVYAAVAEHPETPPATLARLFSRSPDRSVRATIVKHRCAPPEVLDSDEMHDPGFRWSAAVNPSTPPARLVLLLDGELGVSHLVVKNPACPERVVRKHATSDNWRLACAALENPACPQDILRDVLAQPWTHSIGEKQQICAANPNTPPDILDGIVTSHEFGGNNYKVAYAAAVNPSLPEATMDRVLTDPNWSPCKGHVANNPLIPDRLLFAAAPSAVTEEKASPIAARALRRADCPTEVIEGIRRGCSLRLHALAAAHPNTDPAGLVEYATSWSDARHQSVVVAASGNPSTPRAVREELAQHQNDRVSSAARESLQ